MITQNIFSEEIESKLTNENKQKIYNAIELIPKRILGDLSDKIYEMIIENADKKLKKHVIGRMIFHLYNIERLGTYIGMEKLIHGALIVDHGSLLKILNDSGEDTSELITIINDIL